MAGVRAMSVWLLMGLSALLAPEGAHAEKIPNLLNNKGRGGRGGSFQGSRFDDPRVLDQLNAHAGTGFGKPGISHTVHNQKTGVLDGTASTDLTSPEAWEKLKCNACLVTTVEIATTLRDYWRELEKREKRKLKKQEAIDVMRSTCNDDSVLSRMGLVVEGGVTRITFYHEEDKPHLEKSGYELRTEPAIRALLQAECTLLLDEYLDDFLVIVSRNHQNMELQNNLCSPAPGIHHCEEVEEDWIDRKRSREKKREEFAEEQRRQLEERKRDFLESGDPLAYLYENDKDEL